MNSLTQISKNQVSEQEREKLIEIFSDVEESKRKLVEGLIEETAFVKGELYEMRTILKETGMIRVNPNNKAQQKQVPIANEYRRTANIYALNIKTLNGILMKNSIEGEDAFDEWIKGKMDND